MMMQETVTPPTSVVEPTLQESEHTVSEVKTSEMKGPEYSVYDSFDEMDLPEKILRGVYSVGFECISSTGASILAVHVQSFSD